MEEMKLSRRCGITEATVPWVALKVSDRHDPLSCYE